MRYVVEIPGTLPTAADHARIREKSMHEAREFEVFMIKYLAARFRDAGMRFERKVYVGVIWVRPDTAAVPKSVSWPAQFIPEALMCANVTRGMRQTRIETFDLGFRVNSNDPRTIIIAADTENELLRSEELLAYA